jgi:hypothetical protein
MQSRDLRRGFVVEGWALEEGRAQAPLRAYLGRKWNGFECPYFDRAGASQVIADQQALLASLPAERRVGLTLLTWDADTVLVSSIPRPRTAAAEERRRPGQIAPTLIHGTPHWNLALGWRWEEVAEDGEPIAKQWARTEMDARINHIRHSLRLERRLAEQTRDGSEAIPVFAHLGEFADTAHKPIPVSVQIGTVTITPRGDATFKLAFDAQIPRRTRGA